MEFSRSQARLTIFPAGSAARSAFHGRPVCAVHGRCRNGRSRISRWRGFPDIASSFLFSSRMRDWSAGRLFFRSRDKPRYGIRRLVKACITWALASSCRSARENISMGWQRIRRLQLTEPAAPLRLWRLAEDGLSPARMSGARVFPASVRPWRSRAGAPAPPSEGRPHA